VAGPQPAQYYPQPVAARRPALRVTTGLTLTATGAILLLAVHVRLSFLSIPVTGLILLATGLSWLWIPVRNKRELIERRSRVVMTYLQGETAHRSGPHCTLAEMLADGSTPPDTASVPAAVNMP
jgi:hypothetical protein